jgi:hypothetical protein
MRLSRSPPDSARGNHIALVRDIVEGRGILSEKFPGSVRIRRRASVIIIVAMVDSKANESLHHDAEDPSGRRLADQPSLPYAKAFVVQFSAETGARLEHATGRVEHLETGRRTRFASVYDLLASIVALLADEENAAPKRGDRARRRSRRPRTKAPDAAAPPP